ncbi:MAG: EAL domain-containing protein [Proteocatella sp.]
MFKNLSIKNKLIMSVIIGCLVPYIIGDFYIKDNVEKWLYDNNIEQHNELLQETADHVDDSMLKNMKNLISMISEDEKLINVDPKINNYTNFDVDTFKFQDTQSESQIMTYFESIQKNYDIVTFVSFGIENGGYIEYPAFRPSGDYDPRERGWYMQAIDSSEVVISEPYMMKVSKDLVISATKSVVSDGRKIGVVSLDLELNDLMRSINEVNYGRSGYVNILSPNDVFINSPGNKEWMLSSVDDAGIAIFHSIDKYNGKSFEGRLDGIDKIFNVYISPYSGWKYISVIDKSEVLEKSRSLLDVLTWIYAITILIILGFIVLISNYMTRPVLSIARVIDKMATFNFDIYENKDFEMYTHQKDEIGEISRALSGMQENFIELNNNLVVMDEQIQNINIHKNVVCQLSLSKDNPFAGVTNSINDLLARVHNYIEQIKFFNQEISYKNDLLMASEEELTVQIEEINTQKEHIRFLADHDPMTNLPNRRSFHEKASKVLSAGTSGAVILLDIDNFKGINDSLGHLFGDKVLQYISGKLGELTNSSVFVSRFGGDEFLILYECGEKNHEIVNFILKIFLLMDEEFMVEDNKVKVEFSMGVSVFPKDSNDIDQLIMNADLAMYEVKNNGKNNYVFFDSKMADHLRAKLDIKVILKQAIARDEFKMVYQPQVDIHSGQTIGYEGLVRLRNHNISPAEFIPIAEENGLIIPMGRIVTKMVVEQISIWNQKGFSSKPISINFSAMQIHDIAYKTFLFDLLEENKVKPEQIVIEITEGVFLEHKDTTIIFLNELRAHGIKIAVDDFGTGFSSLSYLTFLPIDTLKFDRMLSIKFLELENIAVMDSLIALAHSLKLKVIAEGIEDYDQVRRLIVGKCDAIQGYYFSRPLEVEDVENGYNQIYTLK